LDDPNAIAVSKAPVSPVEQSKGQVLAGRYRLDHLLGQGGMGAVWAATHLLTHKRVAVKLLPAEVASPETLRRFVREARAASAVRHPNVVEIHDILTFDDGSPALVMDLLEGETLAQHLERSGFIPLAELASIMAPVLSAVGSAHAAGIVHRDLKPDNIFLARLGDGRIEPMVLDFGIAKLMPLEEKMDVETTGITRTGSMLGTPLYMAPEQAFGEKDVDARADVWALGVILYECSSGRRPIDGDSLGQVFKMITVGPTPPLDRLMPDLPAAFVALVDRMMQRDRKQRIRDLREPFEFLRGWSGVAVETFGPPISISPPTDGAPAGSPRPSANRGGSVAPAVHVPERASPLAATGPLITNGVRVAPRTAASFRP
jgi:serine/threonine protein kinase